MLMGRYAIHEMIAKDQAEPRRGDRTKAIAHWQKVMQTFPPNSLSWAYAAEALKELDPYSQRTPGEDDE